MLNILGAVIYDLGQYK